MAKEVDVGDRFTVTTMDGPLSGTVTDISPDGTVATVILDEHGINYLCVEDLEPIEEQTKPDRNTGPGCHYCGGDPVGFGFFDEPVCRECGG